VCVGCRPSVAEFVILIPEDLENLLWYASRVLACRTNKRTLHLPLFVWEALQVCTHCRLPRRQHAQSVKCLSLPTNYALHVGCVRAPQIGNYFLNPFWIREQPSVCSL
jgi:hypothetical protein